jgi:molybdate transport repressor ModE-like protein
MSEPRRYFKELRFRQLRALVELSRKGSFSAVAEAFQMSVPSVWQQVRALEDEFGVEMVRQTGKSAALTEQGELLVQLAQPLVEGFDHIREIFANKNARVPRRITIATTASLLLHELQAPLAVFRERFPDVEITLIDRPSAVARKLLETGEADVAILGQIGEKAALQLAVKPLTNYPFLLVCPEGHPLLRARTVKLADVIKHPLVMPSDGSNSRRHVQEVLEGAGHWQQAHIALTASSFDILAGYVRMGFGISVTSISPMIVHEANAGHPSYRSVGFRDISRLFGQEQIVIAHRKTKIELPHHKAFRDIVISNLRDSA